MSNKQAQPSKKIKVANIILVTLTGDVIIMDLTKVALIDKETGQPIFKEKA